MAAIASNKPQVLWLADETDLRTSQALYGLHLACLETQDAKGLLPSPPQSKLKSSTQRVCESVNITPKKGWTLEVCVCHFNGIHLDL